MTKIFIELENDLKIALMAALVLLIIFIIGIIMLHIYLKLSADLEMKKMNMIYKKQIELYGRYIEDKERTMLEVRKEKHNLKNQLIYLLELSKKRDYNELISHLEKLIERYPFESSVIAKTDNMVIDAMVNEKYAVAKQNGIDFSANLDVPVHLDFDSIDLCIILGNALDNAIEASKRSNIKERYIKLQMRLDAENLIINMENSFDGNIKRNKAGELQSLKSDADNHGIGLRSIQKSVDTYHGLLKTEVEDNVFKLKIVLFKQKLHGITK